MKKILLKHKAIYFVFLLSILATIIFTWPFFLKLPHFYSDYGDYPLNGTILWYNFDSITVGRIFNQAEYFNGFELYPLPFTLAFSDHRLIPSIIFSPIYWLTNSLPFSVNSTTFLTFAFSFISAFYFCFYFTKNFYAGIIGALVYAFNPLTFSRFPLHLDLLNKYFLPLVFLFAYKFLKEPNLKNSFIFYLFFTLNSLSANYFELFTIIGLPIFSISFFFSKLSSLNIFLQYLLKLAKYSVVGIIFLPIILYFNLPYLEFSQKEGAKRTLGENVFFSARIIDWISSNRESYLYGNFVNSLENQRAPKDPNTAYFNHEEHTLFLNILPLILMSLGIICLYKRKKYLLFFSFFLLLLFSFIFTFGPFFQGWNNHGSTDIKLPYYYLYENFPFFKGIRAPTRFQFIFYVPFSFFVAFGFVFLSEKLKKINLIRVIFVICVLILFIENYNLKSHDEKSLIINKLNNFNAKKEFGFLKDKKTLHLPIYIPDFGKESTYSNWLTFTGERIVNGNTGYLADDQINFLNQLKDKINEKELIMLSALKVDYLIFHIDLFGKDLARYSNLFSDLNESIVYDKNQIQIFDLKKINLQYNTCNFNTDFSKEIKTASLKNYPVSFYIAILKNKKDCYLPNILNHRYQQIFFPSADIYGHSTGKTAYLRMPLIIEPYQEIVLAEIYNNLRIE